MRATLVFLLASLVTMTGCVDNKKKMQQARKKLGLEARLVFTLGRIETDTKVKTSAMPLPDAGALQQEVDWGAGRLVHVELKSVRVATDFEKKLLAERH